MSYDFLGKGLRYPFRFQSLSGGTQVSTATSREHEHIRESILQILGTRIGERFMNPEFGSRLKDLVFEQNDEVLKGLLRHYVIDAIKRWEKRVIITEVRFDDRAAEHRRQPAAGAYRLPGDPEPGGRQPGLSLLQRRPEQSRAQLSPAGTRAGTAAGAQRAPVTGRALAVQSALVRRGRDEPRSGRIPSSGQPGNTKIAYIEGAFQDRNGKWIVSDPGDNHGNYLTFEGAPETEAPQAEHALYLAASGHGIRYPKPGGRQRHWHRSTRSSPSSRAASVCSTSRGRRSPTTSTTPPGSPIPSGNCAAHSEAHLLRHIQVPSGK